MTDFYTEYMCSTRWKHKRLLRLKIDGFKCRTCWNENNLEVHHLTYDNLGDENLEELITLCKDCHEAVTSIIRDRRYKENRKLKFTNEQEREKYYVEKSNTSIEWGSTCDYAQRATLRPNESGSESNEENLWQTFKNGC